MTWYNDMVRSVEDVWILWSVSCVLLCALTRRLAAGIRRWNTRRFVREERGASYSLGVVLVVPFYALLMATVVETTLMLVIKTGTTYAAYAAARSAIVWLPDDNIPSTDAPDYIPPASRRGMVHLAAVNAMWPYASGQQEHQAGSPGAFRYDPQASQACIAAYHRYSGGKAPDDYLDRKWRYAAKATRIKIERSTSAFNADLTVTVEYEMPLDIPGVGRFLGHRPSWSGARFFTRKISSTVTLEMEGPKSDNQSLGITYYRDQGFSDGTPIQNEVPPDPPEPPKKKRFKGTLIFGSLGIPNGSPVDSGVVGGHIWLRDLETGQIYRYAVFGVGVGLSTKLEAYFMQAPVYVTATDPLDLEGDFGSGGYSATLGGGLARPIEFELPNGGTFETGLPATLGVGADVSYTGLKIKLEKVYDNGFDALRDTSPGQLYDWLVGGDD